jgi:hypothetical protein
MLLEVSVRGVLTLLFLGCNKAEHHGGDEVSHLMAARKKSEKGREDPGQNTIPKDTAQ